MFQPSLLRPVNQVDPSGQCTSGSWWCDALHSALNTASDIGTCLGNWNAGCGSPKGLANIGAGFLNQGAQVLNGLSYLATGGQYELNWSVGAPYMCAALTGSYQLGEALEVTKQTPVPTLQAQRSTTRRARLSNRSWKADYRQEAMRPHWCP